MINWKKYPKKKILGTGDSIIVSRPDGTTINFDSPISVDNSGNATFSGNVTIQGDLSILNSASQTISFGDNDKLYFGDGNDLEIYHDTSNSHIKNNTGRLQIFNFANNEDILIQGNDGGSAITALTLDMSDAGTAIFNHDIKLADNGRIKLGDAGNDLEISHSGTNSFIENNTGDLNIIQHVDNRDIKFQADDGSGGVTTYFYLDGSSKEIRVNEEMQFEDNVKLNIGTGEDLTFKHDGTNSNITNSKGNLIITNQTNDGDIILQADDGSGGDTAYLTLDGSATELVASKNLRFDQDNSQIYFAGNNTFVGELSNSGKLQLRGGGSNTAATVYIDSSGNMGLGTSVPTKKLTVTTSAVNDGILGITTDGEEFFQAINANSTTFPVGVINLYYGANANVKITALSNEMKLGDSQNNMTFFTASSERMRLTNTGQLGIGTNSPAYALDVASAGNTGVRITSAGTGPIQLRYENTASGHRAGIVVDNNGLYRVDATNIQLNSTANVGIGTASPSQKLHVDGHVLISGEKYYYVNGTGAGVGSDASGNLILRQNSANLMTTSGGDATFTGGLTVTGNLTVNGTTTTIDTTNLNVEDKNITLNYSSGDSSSTADGAGITIQDAVNSSTDATILWDATNDEFDFSHGASFADDVKVAALKRLYFDGGGDTFVVENAPNNLQFKVGGNQKLVLGNSSSTIDSHLKFSDNYQLQLGTDADMQFFHTGGHLYMYNATGDMTFRNNADNADIIFQSDDGSGGIATYFKLDGSSASSGTLYTQFPDNSNLTFGSADDLQIKHDGTDSKITNSTGDLVIRNLADDEDIIFQSDDGSGGLSTYFFLDGSQTRTQFDKDIMLIGGANYIFVDNSAATMTFADGAFARFGTSGDLRISHDSNHSYISQEGTGSLFIRNTTDDADIIFQSDDGSGGLATYFQLDGSQASSNYYYTRFPDKSSIVFGDSNDLRVYHDSTDSSISNETGNLYIQQNADDKDIIFRCDDGAGSNTAYITLDGSAVENVFSKDVRIIDNEKLMIGSGQDTYVYHNGSNTYFDNYTGDLYFRQEAADKDIIFQCDNGSGSIETYFFLDGSASSGNPYTIFPDNSHLGFGSGYGDLQLHHDGTDSYIKNRSTGRLIIQQDVDDNDIIFNCDDGSGGVTAYLTLDGSVTRTKFAKPTQHADDIYAYFGDSDDLRIFHSSGGNIANHTNDLRIQNWADDKDIRFECDDGSGGLTDYIRLDGSVTNIKVYKDIVFADNIDAHFGTGGDLRIYHDGTDSRFQEFTGNLNIINYADDKDITLQSDDGSGGITAYLTLDGSEGHTIANKEINFPDGVNATFGNATNGDLRIHHTSGESVIHNTVGHFYIGNLADDKDIIFQSDDGSGGIETYFYLDGGQNSSSPYTVWPDHSHIAFGTSYDLDIYHTSTQSIIENWTGNFTIRNNANDADLILECDDGSGGVTPYLTLDGSATKVILNQAVNLETSTSGGLPSFIIKDNARSGSAALNYIALTDSADAVHAKIGYLSGLNTELSLENLVGNTSLVSSAQINIKSGGSQALTLDSSQNATFAGSVTSTTLIPSSHIYLGATKHLYLDGGGDTYIKEAAGNEIAVYTGALKRLTVDYNGLTTPHNLVFSAAGDIVFPDNAGAALEFKEGSNLYMRFVTTNGSEKIEVNKNLTLATGSGLGFTLDGNTITGIDDSGEFTDDDNHIMTSAAINDKFLALSGGTMSGTITMADGNVITGSNDVKIYARSTDTGASFIQFQNLSTGSSNSDGLTVGVNATTAYVWQRESASLLLGTNDTTAVEISDNQTATFSNEIIIGATNKIYLDGGSNTYISEDQADNIVLVRGGNTMLRVNSAGVTSSANVYSGNTAHFRNYGGVWKATTGLTGNGFEFINSVDGTAMTLSSTGNMSVTGNVSHAGLTPTTGTDIDQIKEFAMSFTLSADTWTDTGINGTDLATGTYMMQVFVDDHNAGGGHYDEYYSATISWFSTATNSSVVDEIVVHRAGHAPNASHVQFRTQRHSSGGDDLMLQVKQNFAHSAALDGTNGKTMTFKFRRLI